MSKLTILQKRTCDIYFSMKKPNQAKAHKLAGSKCTGKTLEVEACKTLNKPQAKAYLKKLGQRATERAEKTADDVIRELEKLGFATIKNYLSFSEKGVVLKNSDELTDEQLAALSEVSEYVTKYGTRRLRIKLYDKRAALQDLGKHHKLFTEKHELTGKDGKPLAVNITVTKTYKKEKGVGQ